MSVGSVAITKAHACTNRHTQSFPFLSTLYPSLSRSNPSPLSSLSFPPSLSLSLSLSLPPPPPSPSAFAHTNSGKRTGQLTPTLRSTVRAVPVLKAICGARTSIFMHLVTTSAGASVSVGLGRGGEGGEVARVCRQRHYIYTYMHADTNTNTHTHTHTHTIKLCTCMPRATLHVSLLQNVFSTECVLYRMCVPRGSRYTCRLLDMATSRYTMPTENRLHREHILQRTHSATGGLTCRTQCL